MTNASESGHPTSCCSMAELMAVLFFDQSGIHYNPKNPRVFIDIYIYIYIYIYEYIYII